VRGRGNLAGRGDGGARGLHGPVGAGAVTPREVPVSTLTAALDRAGLLVAAPAGGPDAISAITDDSRSGAPRTAVVAVRGSERDGHDFLSAAHAAGAALAIVEEGARAGALPAVVVRDGRRAAAVAAAAFHGEPARGMRFIGVTGTNGKTTTV